MGATNRIVSALRFLAKYTEVLLDIKGPETKVKNAYSVIEKHCRWSPVFLRKVLTLRSVYFLIAFLVVVVTQLWPSSSKFASNTVLSAKAALGKRLFFEAGFSEPRGQSCATCHDPNRGFADPQSDMPTSNGANTWIFGPRNAPTVAYASFSPPLQYKEQIASYIGGQFHDGRVDTLKQQAELPFLNPLEMHNYNKWLVVEKLKKSTISTAFKRVYGANSLDLKTDAQANAAFANIADAIAEYERSKEVNRFSSTFDSFLKGQSTLTSQQVLGFELFNGKGRCFFCHSSTIQGTEPAPLFTNHLYSNLGVPKNWNNAFLYMPESINPFGEEFIDLGLGNTVANFYPEGAKWEDGKFKTPTLRNVAKTAPYMHNGVFKTLKEVVHFYNTRDLPEEGWPSAEVFSNINTRIGNLGLTDAEEDAIVEFLKTLDDR